MFLCFVEFDFKSVDFSPISAMLLLSYFWLSLVCWILVPVQVFWLQTSRP